MRLPRHLLLPGHFFHIFLPAYFFWAARISDTFSDPEIRSSGYAVVRRKGDGWVEEADGRNKRTHQTSRIDGGFARAKNTVPTRIRPYTRCNKKLKLKKKRGKIV